MRKICVITGTRAEYGILSRLMNLIKNDDQLKLQIIATNMHLSPEFGLTYKEIESDGFTIDRKVEMLLSSDTPNGTVKSMGLSLIGLADALDSLSPDLLVILGDRYEMLTAAQAALIYKIPVVHLYGGEITEGAYDDAIRHAITKLSHLHFTSTEEYRNRVIQMGECPDHVFYVGALGIDNIQNSTIIPQNDLEKSLKFQLGSKYLVVTFHPVTMENATASDQCTNLLEALENYLEEYKIIFTLPNSDTDGRIIISLINTFVSKHKDRCFSITSLGRKRYYSALKYSKGVIGNSSSGLVEAPSFGIPTLNIGIRQQGRARGNSIIDCDASLTGIKEGLHILLSEQYQNPKKPFSNPYFKESTLYNIFKVIKNYPLEHLINKTFYNL